MKTAVIVAILAGWLTGRCLAADTPSAEKRTSDSLVTVTFWVEGTQCVQCVDDLFNSLLQLPGAIDFRMSYTSGFAVITLNPKKASYHQIAQRIADTKSLHGEPYRAFLKLDVPEYAMGGNAARVDAVFQQFTAFAEIDVVDRKRGRVYLRFKPLKPEAGQGNPRGLDFEALRNAIQAPSPKGLGLKFTVVHDWAN